MANNRFRYTDHAKQRGLALVIVIWILTLLTLMAGSFAMSMRRDNSVSLAIKTSAEASALAESGIVLAQFMLLQSDPELRWQPNVVYRVVNPDSEIRIRVLSETGKIDINTSDETQLAALINWIVADEWEGQRLLNAILDWRDADDDTRTLGAEKRQYRLAGLSYGPTNSVFQSLDELQLVLGMNEEIFSRMQPFITVYSGKTEVDLQYASPQLLTILAKELKGRNIDDTALKNRLDQVNDGETNELMDSGAALGSQNQTYTIDAEAIVQGEGSAGLEVITKSQGSAMGTPFQVLDWKQTVNGPSLFDEAIEYPVITIQDEFRYDDRY